MPENVVLIFLRYPEPGQVKTRLAAQIGPEQAALIYKTIAGRVIAELATRQGDSYDIRLYYAPSDKKEPMRRWLGAEHALYPQQGDDLGQRMRNALEESLAAGYQRAIIVGSDCPSITHDIVSRGGALLGKHDVVIGPALDGGYYLLGVKACRPELFSGIAWGTDAVFSQTQEKIQRLHLTCGLLPLLRDIDLLEDWEWYCRQHRDGLNT
jgi:hypothetical protein